MKDSYGRGGKIAAAKYSYGCFAHNHIVGLHLVTAFFSRHEQLAQIAISTVLVSEEIRYKFCS